MYYIFESIFIHHTLYGYEKKNETAKKMRKIHGNPISLDSHSSWTESYFLQNCVGSGSVWPSTKNVDKCVVHMRYHPLLKTPMPWYSFIHFSTEDKSHLYTIHWMVARFDRLNYRHFRCHHIFFFVCPVHFRSFSFLILLLLYFSWKNANN